MAPRIESKFRGGFFGISGQRKTGRDGSKSRHHARLTVRAGRRHTARFPSPFDRAAMTAPALASKASAAATCLEQFFPVFVHVAPATQRLQIRHRIVGLSRPPPSAILVMHGQIFWRLAPDTLVPIASENGLPVPTKIALLAGDFLPASPNDILVIPLPAENANPLNILSVVCGQVTSPAQAAPEVRPIRSAALNTPILISTPSRCQWGFPPISRPA